MKPQVFGGPPSTLDFHHLLISLPTPTILEAKAVLKMQVSQLRGKLRAGRTLCGQVSIRVRAKVPVVKAAGELLSPLGIHSPHSDPRGPGRVTVKNLNFVHWGLPQTYMTTLSGVMVWSL